MKKLLLIILLFSATASANEWSKEDKILQAAYFTVHALDWMQTRAIANDFCGDGLVCEEHNPILGSRPSKTKVDAYFLTAGVLHYLVADRLNPKWRKRFQYLSIGIQVVTVAGNKSQGIRIKYAF